MSVALRRSATSAPASYNDADNTIDIVWSTGAPVLRTDDWTGVEYIEVLSMEAGAVRLERLNLGAPFLDVHRSDGLDMVVGSVVPGSAKIVDGHGVCTILLSKAAGVADTVQKIREGVIRNISVGYWTHKIVKTEGDDGVVARWDVVDWEPLEISAVPIPADPGSQVRSLPRSDRRQPGSAASRMRGWAARAGMRELSDTHIARGTSEADFALLLAGRLAASRQANLRAIRAACDAVMEDGEIDHRINQPQERFDMTSERQAELDRAAGAAMARKALSKPTLRDAANAVGREHAKAAGGDAGVARLDHVLGADMARQALGQSTTAAPSPR